MNEKIVIKFSQVVSKGYGRIVRALSAIYSVSKQKGLIKEPSNQRIFDLASKFNDSEAVTICKSLINDKSVIHQTKGREQFATSIFFDCRGEE